MFLHLQSSRLSTLVTSYFGSCLQCNIIVDEQAEDIIRFVGEQMQYDELANELCNKTTTGFVSERCLHDPLMAGRSNIPLSAKLAASTPHTPAPPPAGDFDQHVTQKDVALAAIRGTGQWAVVNQRFWETPSPNGGGGGCAPRCSHSFGSFLFICLAACCWRAPFVEMLPCLMTSMRADGFPGRNPPATLEMADAPSRDSDSMLHHGRGAGAESLRSWQDFADQNRWPFNADLATSRWPYWLL